MKGRGHAPPRLPADPARVAHRLEQHATAAALGGHLWKYRYCRIKLRELHDQAGAMLVGPADEERQR